MENQSTEGPYIGSGVAMIGARCAALHWNDAACTPSSSPVILVVEDEWLLRQAIVDELSLAGWTVVEAYSGESALDILESGAKIDLLVTDIRLGGDVTGWDVAEAVRNTAARFPVIYVSGNSPSPARAVTGSVFLSKPCAIEKLLETCRKLYRLETRS